MNDIVRVDGMMARNLPAAGRDTIGQTSTGGVAVALTRRREPDVVLMDVPTPDLDGIAATGRV
jgi:DNA-binding NarL/FixJ family response regulator